MNIDWEQVVAAALLKFGVVDNLVLEFILDKLNENLAINLTFKNEGRIFDVAERTVSGLTLRTDEGAEYIFNKLQCLAGTYLPCFIESLDLKEMVMRKVVACNKWGYQLSLTQMEAEMVEQLHKDGYLTTWLEDGKDDMVILTNLGAAYIYMLDNRDRVQGLKQEIEAFGHRTDLLELYFSQKRDMSDWSVYESLRYKEFVMEYERMMGEARN